MNWLLALSLIAAAVFTARPGSAARERLLGSRTRLDRSRLRRAIVSNGPRLVAAAVGAVTVTAGVFGGPVGALIAAAYAGLGAHEWDRSRKRRRIEARRATDLDEIANLVAELRAGVPPVTVAAARAEAVEPDLTQLTRLTSAVWHLAERTGAPAADLLERIERDGREADRSARSAGAQAAGSQTTAVMLAVLPVAGIGMGHVIGGDPIDVLLHTPWGSGCAIGALILQIAGLKWAQRLTGKATS